MSYRTFRNRDEQTAAEEQHPERFELADVWLALAERADALGDTRQYSPDEWEQHTGYPAAAAGGPVTASSVWTLRADYEAARLAAKWLTLDGLDAIAEARDTYAVELRGEINPVSVRGTRAALYILEQATIDPDRRRSFSKLIRDLDLGRAALYRPAEASIPPPSTTPTTRAAAAAPAPAAAQTTPASAFTNWSDQASTTPFTGNATLTVGTIHGGVSGTNAGWDNNSATVFAQGYNDFLSHAAELTDADRATIETTRAQLWDERRRRWNWAKAIGIIILEDAMKRPGQRRRLKADLPALISFR